MVHRHRRGADSCQAAFNMDQAAGVLLGAIFDGRLDVHEAAALRLQARAPEPQGGEQLPARLIEETHVMHHRQVPQVIAMPGVDRPTVGLDEPGHVLTLPSALRRATLSPDHARTDAGENPDGFQRRVLSSVFVIHRRTR